MSDGSAIATPTSGPTAYLGAGLEAESSCLLVVIGARATGSTELLALELGDRESTESWSEILRSLLERGLVAPLLAVGALGLWVALAAVFPSIRHQRCWNHRAMNLADRLPKRLQSEFRPLPSPLPRPTRAVCEAARDELAVWLPERGQDEAAETLYRDWDSFTTFFDFPADTGSTAEPATRSSRSSPGEASNRRCQASEGPRERALPRVQDRPAARPALARPQRRGDRHGPRPGRARLVDGMLVHQSSREVVQEA